MPEKTVLVADVAPYQPGQFWRRELPCLRLVLAGVRPHTGSQRHPLLSLQTIALPSPATPCAP